MDKTLEAKDILSAIECILDQKIRVNQSSPTEAETFQRSDAIEVYVKRDYLTLVDPSHTMLMMVRGENNIRMIGALLPLDILTQDLHIPNLTQITTSPLNTPVHSSVFGLDQLKILQKIGDKIGEEVYLTVGQDMPLTAIIGPLMIMVAPRIRTEDIQEYENIRWNRLAGQRDDYKEPEPVVTEGGSIPSIVGEHMLGAEQGN